jgi:hypothetical protein
MFGWLKKITNKQVSRDTFADDITRVVGTYGSILNSYPHHIIDASWLPASKENMAHIFKLIITAGERYEDEAQRGTTENYWCMLSRFQAGVGGVPIDIEISKDNPTVTVWRERAARVGKWLEIANAEADKYEREIEQLRQQRQR